MNPKKEKELIEKIVEAVPEGATYSGAKNIYKTNEKIRTFIDTEKRLEAMYPSIIRVQRIWDRPVSVEDKLVFIQTMARNRAMLISEVYEQYPELEGKDIVIDLWKITVKN